jgi:hypothetical protein
VPPVYVCKITIMSFPEQEIEQELKRILPIDIHEQIPTLMEVIRIIVSHNITNPEAYKKYYSISGMDYISFGDVTNSRIASGQNASVIEVGSVNIAIHPEPQNFAGNKITGNQILSREVDFSIDINISDAKKQIDHNRNMIINHQRRLYALEEILSHIGEVEAPEFLLQEIKNVKKSVAGYKEEISKAKNALVLFYQKGMMRNNVEIYYLQDILEATVSILSAMNDMEMKLLSGIAMRGIVKFYPSNTISQFRSVLEGMKQIYIDKIKSLHEANHNMEKELNQISQL